jgi:hypothetical protein
MSTLTDLAKEIATGLGPGHVPLGDYTFAIPNGQGTRTGRLDAAVFSSYTPSIDTILVGLLRSGSVDVQEAQLRDAQASGARVLLVQHDGHLAAFDAIGDTKPVEIADVPTASASEWMRAWLIPSLMQMELPGLAAWRDLLVSRTTTSLRRAIENLMGAPSPSSLVAPDAFAQAIGTIRDALFGAEPPALSFDNVPLEAIAEMYQTLGVTPELRRKEGIVYTPAWIARDVVRRLPPEAFANTVAADVACGSGTFLVCWLERFIDEANRRGDAITDDQLVASVLGRDTDLVALDATRLTLDLLARRLGHKVPLAWNLARVDSTLVPAEADVLVSNLPFGHRTHAGRSDRSVAILQRQLSSPRPPTYLGIILSDTFLYREDGEAIRRHLAIRYAISEMLVLPEPVFANANAETIAVIATEGGSVKPIVVRRVGARNLPAFRMHGTADTFAVRLPNDPGQRWVISPFFHVTQRMEEHASNRLGEVAEVLAGSQPPYGSDSRPAPASTAPLLVSPQQFAQLDSAELETVTAAGLRLRRRNPGPTERYREPKLIVRATTNPEQRARLAALVDREGLWFLDKFMGIWTHEAAPSLEALAAVLQTAAVELWLQANNRSRKLRKSIIEDIPLPPISDKAWQLAEELGAVGSPIIAGRWAFPRDEQWDELETAVFEAFGIDDEDAAGIIDYLRRTLTRTALRGVASASAPYPTLRRMIASGGMPPIGGVERSYRPFSPLTQDVGEMIELGRTVEPAVARHGRDWGR